MNAFLETGISLVLIFFIFSIITYVIQELIAINLKYRSKMLWKSLAHLLDGIPIEKRKELTKAMAASNTPNTTALYDHAQIASLKKNPVRNPNYIPAANFALAIMDLIAKKVPENEKKNDLFIDFQNSLKSFVAGKGNIRTVLKNLADTSPNIKELQKKIEAWFNSYMNRVTGWYESHTIVTVRLIAIVLTLVFNINVIKIAKTIYKDDKLRSSLVAMAEKTVDNPHSVTQVYSDEFNNEKKLVDSLYNHKLIDENKKDSTIEALVKKYTTKQTTAIKSYMNELDSVGLPLGWAGSPLTCKYWEAEEDNMGWGITFFLAIIGWIIGAGCISMGAPFWFDMLNKLVNVRRSGVKPPNK